MTKLATIIGLLSAIAFIFCESCRPEWIYHFGPHRYELQDSFETFRDNCVTRHYVFKCVKDCPRRDTFPPMKLAELSDSSVKTPDK